ncbi:MAG: GspH/FimT family pseudopilin [Gammaproteobacteria bacterium]|nr:GspH/FimT family pseudopilin [Gammaproteobacteria bacterium]
MSRGYTLLELLAALALVAVLATLAYPGFGAWLLDSRRDAIVTTAMHAVQAARQFAATRGESTELCGTIDALRCSGGDDWSRGLLVVGADGTVHRSLPSSKPDHGPTIRSNRAVIYFEPGTSFASPATLTICDRRGSHAARAVIVSRSGRPRISERDATNRKLRC